ncbi:uncharacterized protein LOC8053621 [Ixodes scapularis]|uniref:uncharacterized protein LOC8053621 n=1 Tax=Ixodes scapularis TaxID=6945 RepID=UPI001C3810F6|nr:uncharacterized protein LOC8053621 [Ixodes scapularis]
MPTLHKLLLKQYATGPPVPGHHGFPQASHMYPTVHPHMHQPFGMPRLPPPGMRPYGPPVFPIPGHMGAGYPGPIRPFYGKPNGMMGGLPPPPPYAIMPPPPRPPPPPPPPMKPQKRHPASPNVVFADKEPQASSNYDSGEDDTPIIIRGRKNHHGKRRRPIVIEEDVSSEEDDGRPIVVRGRKPYRAHTRRPVDEQDDQLFNSRKRPVTYIEELPEGRPFGTRNYEDDISKPSESLMDDMTSGTRSFLRYPTSASRFFQPEGSRFDNIMASEQRTNMRAAGNLGFYTGSPGMMHELNHLFAQHRQHGMHRFSEDPKMVLSPHLDSTQSMGDRNENSHLFPNQLETQPIKELAPLVFHLPGKGPSNPDKYVQALIVPIQGNLNQMADETLDKGGSSGIHFNPMEVKVTESPGGQSFVIMPPRDDPLGGKLKQSGKTMETYDRDGASKQTGPIAAQSFLPLTYVRPPPLLESNDNSLQHSYQPNYPQPTAIRIVVRNPVDGTSREVFSTSINTGGPYVPQANEPNSQLVRTRHREGGEQKKSKVVIIAIPRNDQGGASPQAPNSRSSTIVNTYYQPTEANHFQPLHQSNTAPGAPPQYIDQQTKLQYVVPKIPYSIPIPTTSSQIITSSSSSKRKAAASSAVNSVKTAHGTAGSSYYQMPSPLDVYSSKQNSQHTTYSSKPSHSTDGSSSYSYQRHNPAQVASSGEKSSGQRRSSVTLQHAKRKHSSAIDSSLGELQYMSSYSSMASGPGTSYPPHSEVPEMSFTCYDRAPGFYADMKEGCQVYHQCSSSGAQQSFRCPNGTAFNQRSSMCEWWYNVDCAVPKDATLLQSAGHEPSYSDYKWTQTVRNTASPPAPLHVSTTRAPHPPTYSSSMSFSVAEPASDNPQMLASYGSGIPNYNSARVSAQTSGSHNRTASVQHTGQKVLRTRKLVSKIRAPLGSTPDKSQARHRNPNPTTTQSPDITAAAAK